MPLHIIKLCVGATSVADLDGWIAGRFAAMAAAGETLEHRHTTRMVPKRADEVLDGGSLYWVIQGEIAVRQRLTGIRPFTDHDGVGRCHLVLDPVLVPVDPRPRRPFQGWRYLADHEVPPDADDAGTGVVHLPDMLRRELRDLGLL